MTGTTVMKLYIERNNLQIELKRYRYKCLLFSSLLLRSAGLNAVPSFFAGKKYVIQTQCNRDSRPFVCYVHKLLSNCTLCLLFRCSQ